MKFLLSQAQEGLKRELSDFAQEHLNDGVVQRSREGHFDKALWSKCGEMLIPGLPVPAEYGGKGFSALDTAVALEGFAYGCEDGGLAFALGAHLFACTIPLWLFGSDQQKADYLAAMCAGTLIATNAMTEAEGGSDAFNMKSRGVQRQSKFHLNGSKSFCANAPVSDLCLTYVLTDPEKGFFGGVSAFLLERKRHDYKVIREIEKLGLRTCSTGQIALDGVVAGADDVLGKPGGGGIIFNRSMEWERIGLSAMNVGTMSRLLERAVAYAKRRKSGGMAISKYQAVSHTLVDIQAGLEACKLLVYQSAARIDAGENASLGAANTKLFVSGCFKSMTVKLMQLYSGSGYEADSEIARVLQDSLACTVYSGTSEIQKNIIAQWMGC